MHARQSQGIREIITDYPVVALILQEYVIECATCSADLSPNNKGYPALGV